MAVDPDDIVGEAKALKAELCSSRAREVTPYVSKGLLRSSAVLLARGHDSWRDIG